MFLIFISFYCYRRMTGGVLSTNDMTFDAIVQDVTNQVTIAMGEQYEIEEITNYGFARNDVHIEELNYNARVYVSPRNVHKDIMTRFEMLTPPERPTIQKLEMHMPPIDNNGIFVMMQTAPTTDFCNYEIADPVNKIEITGSAFIKLLDYCVGAKYNSIIQGACDSKGFRMRERVVWCGEKNLTVTHPIENYGDFNLQLVIRINTVLGTFTQHIEYSDASVGGRIDINIAAMAMFYEDIQCYGPLVHFEHMAQHTMSVDLTPVIVQTPVDNSIIQTDDGIVTSDSTLRQLELIVDDVGRHKDVCGPLPVKRKRAYKRKPHTSATPAASTTVVQPHHHQPWLKSNASTRVRDVYDEIANKLLQGPSSSTNNKYALNFI